MSLHHYGANLRHKMTPQSDSRISDSCSAQDNGCGGLSGQELRRIVAAMVD